MKFLAKASCCLGYAFSAVSFRMSTVIFFLLLIGIMAGCSPYNVKQIGAKRKKSYHTDPLKITTPWR